MESITAVRGELDGLVLANPVHVQKGGIVALLIKAVIASAMAACSAPTSQKNADAAAHARRRSSTPLPSKVRTVLRASRLQPDRQAAKVGAWRTNRAIGCSPSPSSSSSPPCRPGSRGSPTFANIEKKRTRSAYQIDIKDFMPSSESGSRKCRSDSVRSSSTTYRAGQNCGGYL